MIEFENVGTLLVKYDEFLKNGNFELKYAKPGDVGLDLPVIMDDRLKINPHEDYYINKEERWVDVPPMGLAEIPCGLSIKVPDDAWANIKPRSSTGWKRKLVVFEGVIDSGYTGPLYILVKNPNSHKVRIHEWDRLAQLILIPKYHVHVDIQSIHGVTIENADRLPDTERASSGFGSSGGIKT